MTLSCSICQSDITSKPIKFCCKQNYHYDCISEWVNTKATCPICRKDLTLTTVRLIREINEKFERLSSLSRYTWTPPPIVHRPDDFDMSRELPLPPSRFLRPPPPVSRNSIFDEEVILPLLPNSRLRRRRNAIMPRLVPMQDNIPVLPLRRDIQENIDNRIFSYTNYSGIPDIRQHRRRNAIDFSSSNESDMINQITDMLNASLIDSEYEHYQNNEPTCICSWTRECSCGLRR